MLTSGQMSYLHRNSTTDFGSRPKTRTAVCLFGPPDPVETDRIFREQMLLDHMNFMAKYQPITDSETSEDQTTDCSSSSSDESNHQVDDRLGLEGRHQESNQEPRVRRGRVERPSKQRKQSKLSDFYQKTRNYAEAERHQKCKDVA